MHQRPLGVPPQRPLGVPPRLCVILFEISHSLQDNVSYSCGYFNYKRSPFLYLFVDFKNLAHRKPVTGAATPARDGSPSLRDETSRC